MKYLLNIDLFIQLRESFTQSKGVDISDENEHQDEQKLKEATQKVASYTKIPKNLEITYM